MSELTSFALRCGTPSLKTMVLAWLAQTDVVYDEAASVEVVIDSPCGFALQALQTLRTAQQTIVVTWNSCPEYRLDVWDLRPTALLAGYQFERVRLLHTIRQVTQGTWYQASPGCTSLLTLKERVVLRFLASGWADREIARQLMIEPQSLRNKVTEIYQKLCVGGEAVSRRCLATLYYWGLIVPPDDQYQA